MSILNTEIGIAGSTLFGSALFQPGNRKKTGKGNSAVLGNDLQPENGMTDRTLLGSDFLQSENRKGKLGFIGLFTFQPGNRNGRFGFIR